MTGIFWLLSSENNEIFMKYFKPNLRTMIVTQYAEKGLLKSATLPEDYLVNHIASSFVETIDWWVSWDERNAGDDNGVLFECD